MSGISKFELVACPTTGWPMATCMDCIEGQCGPHDESLTVTCHRCEHCGGDDVYGEMRHEGGCPLADTSEEGAGDAES